MSLVEFLRIVYKHWTLLLLTAFLLSGLIFWSTRNEKQQFTSTTLINTGLVSGYTIEKSTKGKVDYAYTQNEFANLISLATANNTLMELSVTLFTKCLLLEELNLYMISPESWAEATQNIPPALLKEITIPGSFEATYENVWGLLDATDDNPIIGLIVGGNSLFGVEHLKSIKVAREGSSDMIRLTYTTTDPGMCRETLATLTEIFIRKHQEIKKSQTADVLGFFKEATENSARRLRAAEDELLAFRVNNKIINYYEQTRFISSKKEEIDATYNSELMEFASADTVRKRLEFQLSGRTDLPALHKDISLLRDSLLSLSAQIARAELLINDKKDSNAVSYDTLKIQYSSLFNDSNTFANLSANKSGREGMGSDSISAKGLSNILAFNAKKGKNATIFDSHFIWKNDEAFLVTQSDLEGMKRRAASIKHAILDAATKSYYVNNTPQGIPTEQLLSQWLDNITRIEESRIRLKIIQNRQREFEQIYSQFAPWGSKLKRIEREIDVSEREYLANLHSYNQALLHQKNMLMATNLKIMDAPFYPTKPAASKRIMLVAVGFIAGMVLPLAILLAMEFLDNTLRKPSRAVKVIGLSLTGGMPKIPSNPKKWKGIRFDEVQSRCLKQIIQDMQLALMSIKTYPKVIAITSTREKEGKTYNTNLIVDRLRNMDEKVLAVYPKSTSRKDVIQNHDNLFYSMDKQIEVMRSLFDICEKNSINIKEYDWIIIEIPGILANSFPLNLLCESHLTLLVCRANKIWNHGDKKALELLKTGYQREPKLIVNATQPDVLEEIIGEIPKRRSWLRKFVKKMAGMGFSEKNKI